MGRKKRGSANAAAANGGYSNGGQQQHQQGGGNDSGGNSKKAKTGESYLVKKYRPERVYSAMEAFVRYTKSHRMLDASYVRWYTGVTPEKPFVFSTRVGGVDLVSLFMVVVVDGLFPFYGVTVIFSLLRDVSPFFS